MRNPAIISTRNLQQEDSDALLSCGGVSSRRKRRNSFVSPNFANFAAARCLEKSCSESGCIAAACTAAAVTGSSGNCELTLATVAIDDPHAAGGRGYRPLGDSPSPSLSGKQSRISRPNPAQISPEIEMERIRSEVAQDENRPMNRPYYQQTLRAWSLLLTPWRAVGGYLLIGLIFVPLGAFLWSDADSIVDMR